MSFTPARLQADGDSGRHRVFRLFRCCMRLHTHQAESRAWHWVLGAQRSQPAQFLSVRLAIPPAQARLTCLQTWVLPNRVGEEANSNTLVRTVEGASGQVCCFMAPLWAPEFGLSSALPLWLYFVMQMSQAFNPPPPPLCCREGAEAWQALMLASSASSPLEPESPFCFEQQFAHQPSEG